MKLKHFRRRIARQKKYTNFSRFLPPKKQGIFKILQNCILKCLSGIIQTQYSGFSKTHTITSTFTETFKYLLVNQYVNR